MVHGFIKAGCRVTGIGRNAESLRELRDTFGASHRFEQVDVGDEEAVRTFADGVLEEDGCPDILINNAAIINRNAPIWEITDEEIGQILAINLKGVVSLMRAFLPPMNEAGRGLVVNFSSGWGRSASSLVAPYCMTKWGIEGLSRAAAEEVSEGVSVVALNPGIIDTDMLRSCFGESAAAHDRPEAWAQRAVPMLLQLGPGDNGQSLTVV
jgi:NAD(P)-dependent dehydrogenase (short-subunit alcohol dehydrogenase family)